MTKKIPEGFQTITPTLVIDGAAKAIDLYKKAFGAKEEGRMSCPDSNKIMHAILQIGTSKLFIMDANPQMNAVPSVTSFYVYLSDVDASFKQAKQAGLSEIVAPQEMFWGDRMGALKDPFGIKWTLATHVRDVSPQEMEEGRKKFMSKAA